MRRLPPLQIGLLVLLVAAQASAKSSDDVFNNAQGQSPCAMKDKFLDTCTTSRRRDDGNTNSSIQPPPPTQCTCTNVFFNLWSVCTYTKSDDNNFTSAALPPCEAWMQPCQQASINITTMQQDSNSPYPKWAFMELPSNGTFDFTAAIESTKAPHWTTAQILLPILVGLAVAVTFSLCLFFVICRRRRAKHERPWMRTDGNRARFQFPTISSVTKVRELDRSNSWNIDERESPLDEYQFVSYPNSIQGSHVGGHVRLSSSSSGTNLPGPPPLKIPPGKTEPVRAWPGKAIWKGPLQSARMLRETLPLPWRSAKRVAVKNVPSYNKFRVDAPDSDSPLSQRTHVSLLGGPGRSRSNLHNETIFEEDSDSDTEDLPLIQKPSHGDAEPSPGPTDNVMWVPPARPNQTNAAQRSPRQIPPSKSPPNVPLPSPPPPPPTRIAQRPPPTPPSVNTPLSPPQSTGRRSRTVPAFPPAPTSPPPPRPSIPSRSPRAPRTPLPPQNTVPPPLPVTSPPRRTVPPPLLLASPPHPPPLLALAPSTDAAIPLVRTHARSDSGSVRSLPMTPTRSDSSSMRLPTTPTPPYVRGAPPTPNRTSESPTDATGTPPHSAPPSYVQRPSQDLVHSPNIPATAPGENARSVRRLPLPPS
ncbi:hypothetical protein GGX14DRAFT_418904 [Mycena pura]|uniref:Uncharacterized protein n=1 Tax=Mycena pura TaxID=153505 RepID=A0AAD6YRM8_9AGAR|nr:hypothetical protein GGX14DRAFT_418904 [Mycena pura]